MLGGDWADAMHDQSDILGNPVPICRAYPRRVKVGDADCYSLLKVLSKRLDAIFCWRQTEINHRSISNHVQDWCQGRHVPCQGF